MKESWIRFLSAAALIFFPSALFAAEIDQVYQGPSSPEKIYSEPVNIMVMDVLAASGRQVHLSAAVHRHGKKFFRSVSDTPIEFSVGQSTAGVAETGRSGAVKLPYLVEQSTGQYAISARLTQEVLFTGSTGYGLLTVIPQDTPLLLVDFDSALYKGLSGKFDFVGVERLRPIDFASEALSALQEKYQVVYLTDWEVTAMPKIRRWIHYWKMPKAPVLFWNRNERVLKDSVWKARELANFLKQWNKAAAAVGGSSSAMVAFRENRIPAVAIKSGFMREPGMMADWREVRKKIEGEIYSPPR